MPKPNLYNQKGNAVSKHTTKIGSFTENGAGTYTVTVAIPAGAWVEDVIFFNTAAWTAATSATLNVGDSGDTDGIFAAINTKTTPTTGDFISYSRKDTGVGAYAGTKALYYSTADTITATITSVGAGTAGRSKLVVQYSLNHSRA